VPATSPPPTGDASRTAPPSEKATDEKDRTFRSEALPNLDPVYHFALRLTGSEAAAEDLVQETFLRAYKSWHQYTPGTRCKGWLFTICRNTYLRSRDRAQKRQELLDRHAGEDPDARSSERSMFSQAREWDPEGQFFRSLVDDRIVEALGRLPEEFRSAVVLRDVEGLTYAEAAEVMGVSEGTAKSRVFRGRRRLREDLMDYASEVGFVQDVPAAAGSG
jgi:RNA polymerase sigma-70 factor, ECF subfamily